MAKDSYWFRHDSNAGRDLKLLELTHIYTHWAKGIYWDVIEVLREQDGYKFDKSKLQILSAMIMCTDVQKFENWYKDCIRLELFVEDKTSFWSESLVKRMQKWESSKVNGDKGGRPVGSGNKKPNKNPTETQPITQQKPNGNPTNNPTLTIIEEDIIEEDIRREDKKSVKFNFKNSLLELGIQENVLKDWLLVRSKKKAANTETAFKTLVSQFEKSSLTPNQCIILSTIKDWRGFQADWVKPEDIEMVRQIDNEKKEQQNRPMEYDVWALNFSRWHEASSPEEAIQKHCRLENVRPEQCTVEATRYKTQQHA